MRVLISAVALAAFALPALSQTSQWKCTVLDEWRLDIDSGRLAPVKADADERAMYAVFDMDKGSLSVHEASGAAAPSRFRLLWRARSEMQWTFVDAGVSPETTITKALADGVAYVQLVTNGNAVAMRSWSATRFGNGRCEPHGAR